MYPVHFSKYHLFNSFSGLYDFWHVVGNTYFRDILQKAKVMKTRTTSSNNYTAGRTAEITIWIIGLLVLALLISSNKASATEFPFEDESYIPDIPFDTERVVEQLIAAEFTFQEEATVDDIPFNTAEIATHYLFIEGVSMVFNLDEESYIPDIPFNTSDVVMQIELYQAMEFPVDFQEETYVDDIPFNTCLVVAEKTQCNSCDVIACTR
jgi:hypothetical protein